MALLALLPLIALAVYLKGQRYDPATFSLDPAFLDEPGIGAAGLLRLDDLAAAVADAAWQADGGVEHFTADTLYEKIDGRADIYLANGVRTLQFVSFTDGQSFIDIFLYDMTTPEQASAMLAVERPPDAPAGDLGGDSYRADASRFFREGRYYVQVIASESSDRLAAVGLRLAQTVAARVRAGSPPVPMDSR